MNKLKKGDVVFVISGKYKGQRGTISSFKKNNHLIVEGINIIKKHVKSNPNKNITGGIIEREAPINSSNVALYNSVIEKPDKIGIKILLDGKKVRYFKSNNQLVDE